MAQRQRNMLILFFTLVVVMIGFGVIIPIMPFYVESFGAGGQTLGLLLATFSIMQFFFAPFWGSLSDQVGRKRIMLIGVLGNVLTQLLMGFASQLWMLFAARALAGILSSATMPTAMAYISDSTSLEERGAGLGKLGAALGVGMVLGPGIGGLLAAHSLSLPFFLAAGLSSIAFMLVLFVLPESLAPEHRSKSARLHGPQLGTMWRALMGPLGFLFVLAFLVAFGLTNFEGIWGLYAQQVFNFGPTEVGTMMMIIGLLSAIVQGGLTGPVTTRWGEVAVIRVALISTALGFVLMLQASTYAGILLAVAYFVSSNAMIGPAVSSLLSKRSTEGHGMVMGLNNSFMSLGRIVGPIWAGTVFDVNPHLPFLSGALIFAVTFLTSLVWLKPAPKAQPVPAAEPRA